MKFIYALRNIYEQIIDMFYHVKTTKYEKDKKHDNVINYMYEPISYTQLYQIFNKYPFDEKDYLVDIGCGKGRVLVVAARYGCKLLDGIDISENLIKTAKENMRICKKTHKNISYELLCMNAKDYSFSSDINKVFLYNPFQLKIFIKVFKALMRSLEEKPREVTIFLCGAKEWVIEYIEGMKKFKLISVESKNNYIYKYTIKNEVEEDN